MNKKVWISLIVIVTLIAGIVGYNNMNKDVPSNVVASGYREGVSLMPIDYDATGVAVTSDFVLAFEEGHEMSKAELEAAFSSDPKTEFTVSEVDGALTISFKEDLAKDTLYKFFVGQTSWLFLTETNFSVVGTLPRHQSTNVPIDTGIELHFSHAGADYGKYFEIMPEVKGSFETFGNAVVFVPKALEPETLYTVTLKAGMPLKGSEEVIEEDYTFSFETSYDESGDYVEPSGYFSYRKILNDFSTEEGIYLPFNYSMYKEAPEMKVATEVYRYNSMNDASDALLDYGSYPNWSYFNNIPEGIDEKGLDNVLSFEQTIEDPYGYESAMHIEADLEPGFYLVKSTWEDISFVTFFQVTDLSYYFFEDAASQYFWMHKLDVEVASSDGNVLVYKNNVEEAASSEGALTIDKSLLGDDEMLIYQLANGDSETLMYNYNQMPYGDIHHNTWSYFQTDRNLYKPDDVVEFYGFVQDKKTGDAPSKLTVEIAQQNWFYYSFWPGFEDELPLVSETVDTDGSFYEGTLTLPNLSEGGYEITVKNGDSVVERYYITVEKYVKPDYKLELSKDKEAVFVGESVNFKMLASFFEGTPVSDLLVNYNIYGADYSEGQERTNMDGEVIYAYTPSYQEQFQDEIYSGFNAYATLPESGELYGNESLRIFMNDIHVDIQTDLDDGVGVVEAKVHTITLDRLNDGSAKDRMDYLDEAVASHTLSGVIYRNEWVKEAQGQYYDYINKVVSTRYNYHMDTQEFEKIELITNEDGSAIVNVTLPEEENVHYTVAITTKDLSGKPMAYNHYLSDYDYEYYNATDRITLQVDKDTYSIGDAMTIKTLENENAIEGVEQMYVFATSGVKEIQYGDVTELKQAFVEDFLPNVEVFSVIFTGDAYKASEPLSIRANYEDYRIDLDVNLDKETYEPGDQVSVELIATYIDASGNKVPVTDGVVNLSMVDEALFALQDQTIETLETLYGYVDGGVYSRRGSHNNGGYDVMPMYGGDLRGGMVLETAMNDEVAGGEMQKNEMSLAFIEEAAESQGSSVNTREVFKDTAVFMNVRLDDNGIGQATFTLPDNVTAWRLTSSAISESLQAGSLKNEVKVTLPFFINPNLNTTYLIGDVPYAGVAGYGEALIGDEVITYTLTCDAADFESTATGVAFEKVNLPMWQLEAGVYEVKITAVTETGMSDAYVESFQVVKSYQEMLAVDSYEAIEGLKISTVQDGMTTLTFADRSKGMYVSGLYNLAFSHGKRVDQAHIAYVASQILREEFDIDVDVDSIELSSYLTEEGGISLLPYSEADLELTVKLLPYIEDGLEKSRVMSYLYQKLYSEDAKNTSQVLYGLALAGEQVLLELNSQMAIENLSYEDKFYGAMTYAVLGDTYMAKHIYDSVVKPYVESYDQVARVVHEDIKDEVEATAMILPLVAALDLEEAPKLYDFVASHYSKTYLRNLDQMRYMDIMLGKATSVAPALTYEYDGVAYEVDFEDYFGQSITLPSSKLGSFVVTDVTSDVVLVAKYNAIGIMDGGYDTDVSVTRHYEDYKNGEIKGNFMQGDIVKVVIDWKVEDSAIDDYYEVTDYAPSGLVPIKNIWNYGLEGLYYWYRDIDGQSVSFGVHKDGGNYQPLYYYARVVSPGKFTADATIIQGSQVGDSFNLGDVDSITIEP